MKIALTAQYLKQLHISKQPPSEGAVTNFEHFIPNLDLSPCYLWDTPGVVLDSKPSRPATAATQTTNAWPSARTGR